MVSESSLNWWSLIWILLRNLNHGFHTLGREQHLIKSEEGVFHRLRNIFPTLIFWLVFQLAFKKLFAEFGAFKASMTIENSEKCDALIKIWRHDMGIFLLHTDLIKWEFTYHIQSPALHSWTCVLISLLASIACECSSNCVLLSQWSIKIYETCSHWLFV